MTKTMSPGEERIEQDVWDALRRTAVPGASAEEARSAEAARERALAMLLPRVQQITARVVRQRGPRGIQIDEVVQEVHLSILEYARRRPSPPEHLDGFIYYRALHVLSKLHRRARREHGYLDLEGETDFEAISGIVRPSGTLEEEEVLRALRECVEELSPLYRDAWRLRYEREPDDSSAVRNSTFQTRCSRANEKVFDCLVRKKVLEREGSRR